MDYIFLIHIIKYILSKEFIFKKFIFNIFINTLKLWSLTEIIFYFYYLYRSIRLNKPIKGTVANKPLELLEKYLSSVEDIQEGISLVLNESYQRINFKDNDVPLLQLDRKDSAEISIESEQDLETLIRHSISSKNLSEISAHLRVIKCNKQLMALKHTEIRSWFFGATIDQIYRGNVEDWIAWYLLS